VEINVKNLEEDEKTKEKIAKWRKERNERFLKSLTPFQQWLYYSKEMGDYKSRRKYFLSPEGEKEIEKRFGKDLDRMPDNWDELKKSIEYDEGAEVMDFLKSLLGIFSRSWGMY
jgi:hypothetical protein